MSRAVNCENLTDPIPTGEYTTSQGIISYDLSTSSTEGAMQVVEVIEENPVKVVGIEAFFEKSAYTTF